MHPFIYRLTTKVVFYLIRYFNVHFPTRMETTCGEE
jgi:hypothetical protein